MEYKNLLFEEINNIAKVTINRADKLNALNIETLNELDNLFNFIEESDSISVVIITGAGEKAFVAGADIKELSILNSKSGVEFSVFGQSVFNKIEKLNKPVIAAVNGYALGGGCELALACHIRYASENAKFGQPEVNLGIIPGYGGTQRLARQIGKGLGMEYILTGDIISAQEAYRIGLVNKIYSSEELILKATELAEKIISKGKNAISASLKSINAVDNMLLEDGLILEAEQFGNCCGTTEFLEGTSAFLEKRKANFER
ncbi:MAG: enoyl-CoA hydratase/isomerase family protein [Bacteroidetes bacterium]|nr:enoyl-CoA hydratase/isomerase family protein [Bacteroidota bacterium]MBU1114876.1 enoyl-CoA hydratase/isomerase family protein [Bacteroidota bacterium]MBU1798814.1 enoyl-CoA hydratase/isomerase family protein [Bacteroidota bacterium]